MSDYDVIIIGGGPAAIQAGLFLGRAKLTTLLIGLPEKSDLAYGKVIGNYFGAAEEPSGLSLLLAGVEQLKRCGVEARQEEVIDLQQKGDRFEVTTETMWAASAKAVVIASGAQLPTAGIRGEKDFLGKGVHTCVACDGPFFKDKKVAVAGSGPHAAEEAIELKAFTDHVTIYSQGRPWEIKEGLRKKLEEMNIPLAEKRIGAVEGGAKAEKMIFADKSEEAVDGIFLATGSAGGVTFANKLGLMMENNFIVIDRDGKTNIPGVWAAGAVTGGNPQIAKSVGEGCNAAVSIIKTLKGLEDYRDQT